MLARESLLYTFIENYAEKFNAEPKLQDIQNIAYIISWNIWQMDGLKGVTPNSCITTVDLFDDITNNPVECKGCRTNNMNTHNGTYCFVMDWKTVDPLTNKKGHKTKFIDIMQDEDGK